MKVDIQPIEPQPVQELWFEDGNIVIEAGKSQYRVYQAFLAARSSVFQDMFAFPQPPDSELFEGCPLVRLPDPDVEVTPFLKAIFDSDFFMPFPAQTDFDTIVGCLRLSHKYGVDYLRRRALVHFSSAYPTTLSLFDSMVAASYGDGENPGWSWEVPPDPAFRIRAIQLAREVEATWILPKALYTLSVAFSDLGTAIFNGAVYKNVPTHLSSQDQVAFLNGHDIQRNATAVDGLGFLSSPFDIMGCVHPSRCHSERLAVIESNREIIRVRPSRLLDIWDPDDWHMLQDVCPTCLVVLKRTHEDTREAFWAKLPEIYDLPSWEELEHMKAAAIGTSLPG
ncbi:hypothetical protein B0H19DRAFT_717201 [Mycena capillaripes]|nr:hypothetical protein B0H19DRAFT_717201 [Mycena capillaripes]